MARFQSPEPERPQPEIKIKENKMSENGFMKFCIGTDNCGIIMLLEIGYSHSLYQSVMNVPKGMTTA